MSVVSRSLATAAAIAALLLGGCMIAKKVAPVVERSPEIARTAKPGVGASKGVPSADGPATYTVKRGDTLFGIALEHGLDHRDLARWNGITNPSSIEVGQVLRVRDPDVSVAVASVPGDIPAGEAVVTPYQSAPAVSGRSVTDEPPGSMLSGDGETLLESDVLTSPKAVKLPYSEAAVASLQAASVQSQPAPKLPATDAVRRGDEPDAVEWSWPTKGKIVATFNENGGPKGVQIAGEMGQPVFASAEGRVVYTGSGLRGYGNLVIIKHNDTYLSAYAHNRQILVKQGDKVKRGQRIAEMGNSDANHVMLHFEIRREGKPVDPVSFLPPS